MFLHNFGLYLKPSRVVLRSFALAGFLITTAAIASPQQNDLKQVAAALARDIDVANHRVVTVADFTDLQGNVTELGRFIAEELSTQLVLDAKSFTIVERIQLAAILKEHQISVSGLIDPATVRKLGQFAGVDALVTGTLVPFSDSVRLTAKVLDVSTAKVIAVSTSDLPRTKAIDDLLSRGISSPSSSGSASGGSAGSSSSQPAPLSSLEHNEFLIAVKSCELRGDRIVCAGSVKNKANRERQFQIRSETTAVDNNGNSYASNQATVGQSWWSAQLMPDLPVNFYVSFQGGDASASKVNLILAYWTENADSTKLVFRNLPLSHK